MKLLILAFLILAVLSQSSFLILAILTSHVFIMIGRPYKGAKSLGSDLAGVSLYKSMDFDQKLILRLTLYVGNSRWSHIVNPYAFRLLISN